MPGFVTEGGNGQGNACSELPACCASARRLVGECWTYSIWTCRGPPCQPACACIMCVVCRINLSAVQGSEHAATQSCIYRCIPYAAADARQTRACGKKCWQAVHCALYAHAMMVARAAAAVRHEAHHHEAPQHVRCAVAMQAQTMNSAGAAQGRTEGIRAARL